jgi:hypothetical protein
MDYDTWFDYLRLLESEGDLPVIREAYEKAIAQIPPIQVCAFFCEHGNTLVLCFRKNDIGVVISIYGSIMLYSKNSKRKISNVHVKFIKHV